MNIFFIVSNFPYTSLSSPTGFLWSFLYITFSLIFLPSQFFSSPIFAFCFWSDPLCATFPFFFSYPPYYLFIDINLTFSGFFPFLTHSVLLKYIFIFHYLHQAHSLSAYMLYFIVFTACLFPCFSSWLFFFNISRSEVSFKFLITFFIQLLFLSLVKINIHFTCDLRISNTKCILLLIEE